MRYLKLVFLAVGLIFVSAFVPPAAAAPTDTQVCGETYKVKRGDTLNKIAKRCDTSISALMMANPQIKNPSLIYAGANLEIPRQAIQVSQEGSLISVAQPEADRLTPTEMARLGIGKDSRERWIDVDLSSQTLVAYEGREIVRTFLISTGTWRTPTVTGQYPIFIKHEKTNMRGPGYFLRDVPYTMYFYRSYGLHGTYWHNNFGTPMSRGCVNLSIEDAAWLFDFAEVGTLVNIRN